MARGRTIPFQKILPAKELHPNVKCHFCGKIGHKIADCRSMKNNLKNQQGSSSSIGRLSDSKPGSITCYRCGNQGHIASACPARQSLSNQTKADEKRVNVCHVVEPIGTLISSGESYPFYFDSGAECSLVRESVSTQLSGTRINNIVVLKGIGNNTVTSTLQILSNVTISGYCLEVLFHVILNDCINYNIIIGREILSQGFSATITIDKIELCKTRSVQTLSALSSSFSLENVNTELCGEDRKILVNLLNEFCDSFIDGFPKNRVTTGELEVRLIDPIKTVHRRPYRLSIEEKQIVRNKVNELLLANIIRPSSSPFASPVLLVKKKNGSDRLCVDYRELNTNTVAEKYPLPLISDQISRLRGASFFSCLDMASGFHQIPIHANSIERTAFVTPDGQFEFLTMPFGLKNAPSVFQRAVMKALGELAHSYVIVYMDETKEETFVGLRTVLKIISQAGFSFNIGKCSFLKSCVEYLGFVVKEGEIRPNPSKIKALVALPPPQSVTQERQFIGLASYFRQFVPKFSEIMKPLYRLTCKNKIFEWKLEHEQIRQKVTKLLTDEPVLVIFDPRHPIKLHTDASMDGYGAILLHKIDNKRRVVEYYSKQTP